mgnify:CR=1 FL=1
MVDDSSAGSCGSVLIKVAEGVDTNPNYVSAISYDLVTGVPAFEIISTSTSNIGTHTLDVEWYLEDHPTVTYS